MAHAALIFGSSKDWLDSFWRVWTYSNAVQIPFPLAHFYDQARSDTVAFELAHSAAAFENSLGINIDGLLATRDSSPTPLPPKVASRYAGLAEEAIRSSLPPESARPKVTVKRTPDDIVYVVRIPTLQP